MDKIAKPRKPSRSDNCIRLSRLPVRNHCSRHPVKKEVYMRPLRLLIPLIMLLPLTACNGVKRLDHFECYAVEGEVPTQAPLTLKDQFRTKDNVRLVQLQYFCNPVTKIVAGKERQAAQDEDHLACYRLQPEEKFSADVSVRNQFGESRLRTKTSEMLCVPTHKNGYEKLAESSDDCPGGKNCCCNMSDGAGGTWPDCDAGFECRRQVNTTDPNKAIQVCVAKGTPLNTPLQLNSSQPPYCRRK